MKKSSLSILLENYTTYGLVSMPTIYDFPIELLEEHINNMLNDICKEYFNYILIKVNDRYEYVSPYYTRFWLCQKV